MVISSALLEIPRYFEDEVVEHTCNNHTFYLQRDRDFVDHDLYDTIYRDIIYPIFKRYLPLVITSVLTFFLIKFLILRRNIRNDIFVTGGEHPNVPIDHITMVLTIIAIMYILCLIPGAIYPIMRLFMDTGSCDSVYYYFVMIADLLAIVNSSLNFFVYYLNIPAFRESFRSLLKKCCVRRSAQDAYVVQVASTRM